MPQDPADHFRVGEGHEQPAAATAGAGQAVVQEHPLPQLGPEAVPPARMRLPTRRDGGAARGPARSSPAVSLFEPFRSVGWRETQALHGEAVDGRRAGDGLPHAAEVAPAEVVDQDHHHVGWARGSGGSAQPAATRPIRTKERTMGRARLLGTAPVAVQAARLDPQLAECRAINSIDG